MKKQKTNAMRLLDQQCLPYEPLYFAYDEKDFDGAHVAEALGLPYGQVYKTLVVEGGKSKAAVFCLPVNKVLDLKKAAALLAEKKATLLPVSKLQSLTGYVRGGCSPIGMKKNFPTFFHEEIVTESKVAISGGARGLQIYLAPKDLLSITKGQLAHFIVP